MSLWEKTVRAFDDWNEASAFVETPGNPNPYFFLSRATFKSDRAKKPYRSYFQMRPFKKRRLNPPARRRRVRRVFRRRRLRRRPSYKRRVLSKVGDTKTNLIPPKYRLTSQSIGVVTLQVNTLASWTINTCPKGTTRNTRDHDKIDCRGIRTDLYFQNMNVQPTIVNVAWIVNKAELAISDTNAINLVSFLRGYEENRGYTLDGTACGTIEGAFGQINSDLWSIIKHKRYLLEGRLANQGLATNKSYMMRKFWIPIRREFRFNNDTDAFPSNGNMYLVMWASLSNAGPATVLSNVVNYQQRTIMCFKDTE